MNLNLNIFQLLILFSACNGFILSGVILLKRQKAGVNIYLGTFILVFALACFKIVLQEKIPDFNAKLPVPLLYQFAFGPLLYLYLKTAITNAPRLSKLYLWYFLPTLVFDVLPALLRFVLKLDTHRPAVEKLSFMLDILAFVFFCFYVYRALVLINKYKTESESKEKKALSWMYKIAVAAIGIALTWLIYIIMVIVCKGKFPFGVMPYYPIYLVLSICIYSMGIAGYYRPEIGLLALPVLSKKELLSPTALEQQKAIINRFLQTEAYYRDENLTLKKLAGHLDIPLKELSYTINTGFEMNFNDWINDFRIRDFKERLDNPANARYTMMGIAHDVGFSSKTSFYRAFKKTTGQTPGEFYREKQRPA